VTGTSDLLVVRYEVTTDQTRAGKRVQRHAPRLTVFRKQGDNWLVVAHANFATLEK
jgi:ketosteroid isomerase-like protein